MYRLIGPLRAPIRTAWLFRPVAGGDRARTPRPTKLGSGIGTVSRTETTVEHRATRDTSPADNRSTSPGDRPATQLPVELGPTET